ncbi:hypothetical protein BRC96_07875 [Halobacteriales archaeon QS_6_64_34]|nr:MAG: hypothetical protein BRC96_07875 [Halobacteriales archaeon QS_6_64_34]
MDDDGETDEPDADNSTNSNTSMADGESGAIQVTIDQTVDPVQTENETLMYPISGNISMNPPPELLGNVTITINGNRTVTTQPQTAGVSSGENISYGTIVNLTERVNTIDVRVGLAPGNSSEGQAQNNGSGNDEGQPQNDNAGGNEGQPQNDNAAENEGRAQSDTASENEHNSTDTTGSEASATLYLDGDGLPAADEQQVIGTDPLDFDSDSNATESDEADNGTIDGREDFDGDGLGTLQERELGTDPLNADTDGDGLTDGEEYILTETDPLVLDSDDDGTPDASEDPDGDSLTHTAELANGTDPLYADIDNDGLDDTAELDNETDPFVFDTDSDGLSDGTELTASFGTDPTDPDTDGDGIEDGNETFTTETENESLGVNIELTGQGNLASNSTVEPATHARFTAERAPNESLVGSPVYVDVGGNLSEATVTATYNESAISSNESSVTLYRFNETTGAYHRLPSTVDPQNNTVSANTSHFSTIVPFDSVQAIDTATQQAQLSQPSFDGQNQAFEFDTTEAITTDSGNSTTVNGATWTCRNDPRDDGYSDSPVVGVCEFRNGSAYVEEETNRMRYLEHTLTLPGGSSDTDVFIEANLTAHIEAAWSNAAITMVLEDENGQEYDIFRLEQDYGSDTREVSVNPRVNIESANTTIDSDGDGISDSWEENGIPLANTTRTVQPDPNDNDTDSDGVPDGEEVDMDTYLGDQNLSDADVIHFPGYAWSSDPVSSDTDGDGLSDSEEVEGWDIVVNNTSSRSGEPYQWAGIEDVIVDGTIHVTSDPLAVDSDGDGLDDDVEIEETHTDPEANTTYEITEDHEELLANLDSGLREEITGSTRLPELNDATDDSDFITVGGAIATSQVTFEAMDGNIRTDTWLSNEDELDNGTDPWDPDTDDDGLTDGWEVSGSIEYNTAVGTSWITEDDDFASTSPTDPDSDGDGVWDRWVGVYGVGYSDSVVLYREHLQDDDGNGAPSGIQGEEERVDEQTGVHPINVNASTAAATGVDIDGDDTSEHSNVHLGERHWGTDPNDGNDVPDRSLSIEVDYLEGHNPETMTIGSEDVLAVTRENYQLYGITLEFTLDEQLTPTELQNICRGYNNPSPAVDSRNCIEPSSFNVWETDLVENEYHQNDESMHLFFANTYGEDEPQYTPHDTLGQIPEGVRGMEGHTGSPTQVLFIEEGFGTPHGAVMFDDSITGDRNTHRVLMEELGHGLGAGYADDQAFQVGECYSGGTCYGPGPGSDQTPEAVSGSTFGGWSVMAERPELFGLDRTAFSIEELTTLDFEDIPSVED